jgi:colanic acid biosynthesis glycosyl transferase WcaI
MRSHVSFDLYPIPLGGPLIPLGVAPSVTKAPPMPPRLTIIGINYAPESSGNAPYTTALAKGMAELGWDVKVITGFPHYPQWRVHDGYEGRTLKEEEDGVEVLRLRHYVPAEPKLLNRLLMEVHFGLRVALADWGRPDVVLFVNPGLFSSGVASLRARLGRRRPGTAIWIQDLYSRGLEEVHTSAAALAPVMRKVEGLVLRAMDRVIVIHDRFRRHAVNELGVAPERALIHRNWSHITPQHAIDTAAVRAGRGWSEDEVVVLHAGNMGVKQYLENVVDAARLADERGSRVRFVLLGAGNQLQRLRGLAEGIESLEFIDPLPDEEYTAALAAADVLLVNEKPELREMCVPSKLTSYFATGRPVLAAVDDESSSAGEIESSGAGRVIRSGNPAGLLEAAEELGGDRATASAIGGLGPAYVAEHLAADTAMRRWDDVLRSLTQHVRR